MLRRGIARSLAVAPVARRSPAAGLQQQKRGAYIEVVATGLAPSLFAMVSAQFYYYLATVNQEHIGIGNMARDMPDLLVFEEKRAMQLLSKQLDNTATTWQHTPSEGAIRAACTTV
eukprot:TRINITY_DN27393_c0_g2_i1.p5 TRINITY_DN27393_c0_g2~~TRINITY_DN27393_c0_g2_i1.p5  ORF type:complete len:116 (+),score=41.75 TRINITY_DN27393_c0_g2_i1:101-448(+)